MAGEDRTRNDLLKKIKPVLQLAPRSSFFALATLLERIFPDSARVGSEAPPELESIRFAHDPSLGFQAGEISKARLREVAVDPNDPLSQKRLIFEVTTTFLGLTGASSPLPSYFAEEILHDDGSRQREFLDIFHHRTISLLYRSVTRYFVAREGTTDATDPWAKRLLALGGFDAWADQDIEGERAGRLLHLMPLLARKTRDGGSLRRALQVMLEPWLTPGAQVEIREFLPSWMELEPEQHTRLGLDNIVLGQSAVLGRSMMERGGRFAIRMGPLDLDAYEAFQPGHPAYEMTRYVVRMFLRQPLVYDIELELDEAAVPSCTLSAKQGSPLGRSSWLQGQRAGRLMTVGRNLE